MEDESPSVRIPVRFSAEGMELFYGGPVRIAPGTIGELRVSVSALQDAVLAASLTARRHVQVLDEGTELRIVMHVREPLGKALAQHFIHAGAMPHKRPRRASANYGFVPVHLGAARQRNLTLPEQASGLQLLFKGEQSTGVRTGYIRMPPLQGLGTAESLNHAYTQLSTLYEPWRTSHTGNIYHHVYYYEAGSDGRAEHWYPIGDLRERELANTERQVIANAWQRLQAALRLMPGGG